MLKTFTGKSLLNTGDKQKLLPYIDVFWASLHAVDPRDSPWPSASWKLKCMLESYIVLLNMQQNANTIRIRRCWWDMALTSHCPCCPWGCPACTACPAAGPGGSPAVPGSGSGPGCPPLSCQRLHRSWSHPGTDPPQRCPRHSAVWWHPRLWEQDAGWVWGMP